jgi:hypothetical protein
MNTRRTALTRTVLLAVALGGGLPALGTAQESEGGARPGEIATEPIRCWWKTDRAAVHIGERFSLALTCRVIETGTVTVVPAIEQLDPGAVQLTPFEATAGVRHEDIVSPPWRYFQYDYTVRFLGEGMFGQDAVIPPLTVTYNIRAASGGGAQGRDQGYVLPALPVRIVSIAPRDAVDIRDAPGATFAAIQQERFRATTALVVSGVFFAFAAVMVGLAGLRLVGRSQRRVTADTRPPGRLTIVRGCLRALRQVKAEAVRDGWSPALARRSAAVFRIAGAAALGKSLSQTPAKRDAASRDGQILLRTGLLRPRRTLVSAPTTPETLERHLGTGGASSSRVRVTVQQIHDALQTFSAVAYGRNGQIDAAALDAALEDGMLSVRKLLINGLWPSSHERGAAADRVGVSRR